MLSSTIMKFVADHLPIGHCVEVVTERKPVKDERKLNESLKKFSNFSDVKLM